MNEISTYNFFKVYQTQNNLRIIDVRDPYEFDAYHIDGTSNIPLNLIYDKHFLFLNKRHHYYFICKNGQRSKPACLYLEQLGYNITNVVGGIERWQGDLVTRKRKFI